MRRRIARASGVGVVLLLASACGVPADSATRTIDPTEIPYALTAPSSSATTPEATTPEATGSGPGTSPAGDVARVFFLDAGLELSAVAADGTSWAGVQDVLDQLAAGPTAEEREGGLGSALGPDVELQLRSIESGTAAVDVVALSQDPSADRLPLAVGQIVLSVTSVPGIFAVRLQRNGEDREVPLPGGALTSRALTAQDYRELTDVAAASG